MCDCHCHDNYNLDTLVPMVGIVTDMTIASPSAMRLAERLNLS